MNPFNNAVEEAYTEEAMAFMKNAKLAPNPEFVYIKTFICAMAVHVDYYDALIYFGKCIYPQVLVVIMPLFYRVIKCKCHGRIMYCKHCGFSVGNSAVNAYYHIRDCYKFCMDRPMIYVNNGSMYNSVKISKLDSEHKLFAVTADLLGALPQIMAFRADYNILNAEDITQLIQDDKECVRKAGQSTEYGLYTEKVYVIFGRSPEYQKVLNKLTENMPQCIICGEYYDHFPAIDAVIQHLVSHAETIGQPIKFFY